ncbi:hypothetical protein HDU97_003389 [Phlyctochytrium planicorne]|nr:hypothetical protein HDU97_003389 [Phlyctochytrium planicorne]
MAGKEEKIPDTTSVTNMSKAFTNANFPLDDEGRTYHVGTKVGETANRVLTVGDPSRADLIAKLLDPTPAHTRVHSKRGFLTITGAYKGVPVSIVAIGMGVSMMDFFVREVRAVVRGPMAIVRFGSCGSITPRGIVGQIAVSTDGSIMVSRNYDYFTGKNAKKGSPYLFSEPVNPDEDLSKLLVTKMESSVGPENVIPGLNSTADSFYSSQGRIDPNFDDANQNLIESIIAVHPNGATLEMEAFTLLHLAQCATDAALASDDAEKKKEVVKAASSMMIFADRTSGRFIDPETVKKMEKLGGEACLEALIACEL